MSLARMQSELDIRPPPSPMGISLIASVNRGEFEMCIAMPAVMSRQPRMTTSRSVILCFIPIGGKSAGLPRVISDVMEFELGLFYGFF